MNRARLVLLLSLPAYGGVGILFLIAPAWAGSWVGLELTGASADSDVRAVYGGMSLGVAGFLAWASRREDWYLPGIAVQVLTMGALAGARFWSWLWVGLPSGLGLALHAAELVGFAAGLWAWRSLRGVAAPRLAGGSHAVRAFEPEDYPAVRALWERTEGLGLNETDTSEKTAAYLAQHPGLSGVAVDDSGAVVGAVLCGHDGRRGYLHHLAVDPHWRGTGLAKALLAHCLDGLAGCGIDKCNVFVFGANEAGAAFWTANGWLERSDLRIHQRVVPPVL